MENKQYESCPYYQEMYCLRSTWEKLEICNRNIIGKPNNCSGCPLLIGMHSDDLPMPSVGAEEAENWCK